MTRAVAVPIALLIASALLAAGQQAAPPSRQTTQDAFRSGVELLRLPVTVLDSRGQPVPDLHASDFTITVDGSERRTLFAHFFGAPAAAAPLPGGAAGPPLTFADNTGLVAGRAVVFVVDLISIKQGYEGPILDTAAKLADSLGQNDAVGLMPVPGKGVDLTREHARVSGALRQLRGTVTVPFITHGFTVREAVAFEQLDRRIMSEVIERECCPQCTTCPRELRDETKELLTHARAHVQSVLASMTALANALEQVEGPKSIVLLSAGLPFEQDSFARYTDLQRALTRAGIMVYAVQTSQPDNDASNLRRPGVGVYQTSDLTTGLANVATMAGGSMFMGVGTASGIFERVRAEIVNTYELGLEGAATDVEGTEHNVKVTVNRPGVTVRTRPKLLLRAAEPDPVRRLGRLLGQPIDVSDLPIALSAYAVRGDESATLKVIVAAEIGRGGTQSTAVRYGLRLLQDDKIAFQTNDVTAEADHGRVVTAAQLAPGRYRLRVAAFDAAGRAGSAELPLNVGLRAVGGMQFSDLIVGASAPAFHPVIRTQSGQTLDALVELYSADPSSFDVAAVAYEVRKGRDAAVIATTPAQLRSTELERRRVGEGSVTTTGWAPGDYTISAVVLVEGKAVGRVSRSVVVE